MDIEKSGTVFFTGHRAIPRKDEALLMSELYSAVGLYIVKGYDTFICGGAVGFDTMAAECVLSFRERFPHIKLILALPCRDQTVKWESLSDIAKYKDILGQADCVEYVNDFYFDGCMHQRNRWMADRAAVCIAYLKSKRGGTAYTYKYAAEKGLEMLNLYDKMEDGQLSFC